MKNILLLLSLWLCNPVLFVTYRDNAAFGQQPTQTIADKMAKVRAAKAQKKDERMTGQQNSDASKEVKVTPTDYKTPVDKALKGPNGETVHTGERGGKFYINKNGNKTYLSSNQ